MINIITEQNIQLLLPTHLKSFETNIFLNKHIQ